MAVVYEHARQLLLPLREPPIATAARPPPALGRDSRGTGLANKMGGSEVGAGVCSEGESPWGRAAGAGGGGAVPAAVAAAECEAAAEERDRRVVVEKERSS